MPDKRTTLTFLDYKLIDTLLGICSELNDINQEKLDQEEVEVLRGIIEDIDRIAAKLERSNVC